MTWTAMEVVRRRTQWAVRARSSTGEVRELKYRTEAQARFFAAVLALGPSRLPAPAKARIERNLAALTPRAAAVPAVAVAWARRRTG